ncbi:10559_t:CDS:2 [Dentiscutata heterogama]|uniref:10559_t:CDS:1 n=1 Tax=Dentiscutata heterogama TaxID=1316150 RepID=A0ACA9KWS9_9GLOM|nr:10559_t:CDS:2 [Dentiscutata heterogama]
MSNENLSTLIDGFNKLNFSDCQKLADTDDPDGMHYLLRYYYDKMSIKEKKVNRVLIENNTQ